MKIFTILSLMMLLLVGNVFAVPPTNPMEFNEGLTLTLDDFDYHIVDTNLTLHSGIYDTLSGVKYTEANCSVDILLLEPFTEIYLNENFDYDISTSTFDSGNFTETGSYKMEFWCVLPDGSKGGFTSVNFDVVENTNFGFWTPVTDWTFPIVYLIITFILIFMALIYNSSVIGVFGSIMLILSYFIIGATSPLLFAPLLIIGLLLAIKFGSS